jgi:hypothetical protein
MALRPSKAGCMTTSNPLLTELIEYHDGVLGPTGIEWLGSPVRVPGSWRRRWVCGRSCLLCLAISSRPAAPSAAAVMIMGRNWRYPPEMTHDHRHRQFPAGYGRRSRKPWPFNLCNAVLKCLSYGQLRWWSASLADPLRALAAAMQGSSCRTIRAPNRSSGVARRSAPGGTCRRSGRPDSRAA